MAILTSPGVNTSEIDATTSIPAVGTSTGATVGSFRWGPAEKIITITDETQLVSVFGKPDGNTAVSFLSAANFLNYANDLRVVRVQNANGFNAIGSANTTLAANLANSQITSSISIANDDTYFMSQYNTANTQFQFAARYVGSLGNSLRVAVCANTSVFNLFAYNGLFDKAPGTSQWAGGASSTVNDEMHVVVVDVDGGISGTAGTVLERFPNLSKASDARSEQGESIYYKEYIYRNSKYIHWLGHPEVAVANTAWGQTVQQVKNANTSFFSPVSNFSIDLRTGTDGAAVQANVVSAFEKFRKPEEVDISLLFAGDCDVDTTANTTWVTAVTGTVLDIADKRQDCLAFVSPPYSVSVGSSVTASGITNFRNALASTSYGVMDSGWKYIYDKYNDRYVWIPLNSDIAGLCARTDQVRDPWFSPAGFQRGQIRNVVKLSYNPSQADRDTLYKSGVNPVVSFPGDGTLLYGDKTMLGRPSAFDRINVRRLFIVLERSISKAAKASLFELNDEFTRAQFVNLVEPFLRDVKGRRGIFDFQVVCDRSNNTDEVIDSNRFVGDIYIKPARSINFIQLNFVAVRTGVEFNTIIGKF